MSSSTDVDMNMNTSMNTTTARNSGINNTNSSNNNNNSNNNTMKRRAMPRRKHKPKPIQNREGRNTNSNNNNKPAAGGRFGGGRGQGRLWQLPEDAIHNYTTWIQEKPEEDRTPNEERFLWKCMIRSLGVISLNNNNNNGNNNNARINRQERIHEFVDRLGAKEPIERTANEDQFVRMYYKRRNKRKAQRNQHKKQQHQQSELNHDTCKTQAVQTFSWMRNAGSTSDGNNINSNNNNNNNSDIENVHNNRTNSNININITSGNHKNNQRGLEPMASLESLRESMKKMGLSSDKLKQVRFAD